MASHVFCDGVKRRDFIRFGALAGAGLSLSDYLQLAEAGEVAPTARGKAAIFINLSGGPTHMDTFDMKPDAPDTHRGEFNEIKTNVPGMRISEHLPKLAKCADKYAILRGVSHTLAAHKLGSQYLNTGNRPLPSLEFPAYGAIVSKELTGDPELPPFVAVPNQGNNPTGYLGVEYGPFNTGAAPRAGQSMSVRGVSLRGVTVSEVERRNDLLKKFDRAFDARKDDQLLAGLDRFGQKAHAMMRSPKTRAAFDMAKESDAIKSQFNDSSFAQSCLLATRLVGSGVRFVTINFGGWDTHRDNFAKLKDTNLPALDSGLSGLFNVLSQKGLLDSTSVFVTGEFGRTPKINQRGGRDHYPRAMFCLLAGGGMKGGQVIGESDAKGEGPKNEAIKPDDVAASFYHSLGIDHTKEFNTITGRPVMIVRHGEVVKPLFG